MITITSVVHTRGRRDKTECALQSAIRTGCSTLCIRKHESALYKGAKSRQGTSLTGG